MSRLNMLDATSFWPGGIPDFSQPTISAYPAAPPNAPALVRPGNRPQPPNGGEAPPVFAAPAPPTSNPPVAPGTPPPATPIPPPLAAPNPFGLAPAGALPMQALEAAAPRQQGTGGPSTVFPAAQNAALTRYLGENSGNTPGGMLPVGMGMPEGGQVYNGANPLTLESYLRPSGGVSGSVFGNGDIMATLNANAGARDTMLRQRNDMASIPGAIEAQNARFGGGLFQPGQLQDIARYGPNPTMPGGPSLEQQRVDVDRSRVANEAYGRTAAGQRAAAELQMNQAVAEGRITPERARQNMAAMARGGFYRDDTPPTRQTTQPVGATPPATTPPAQNPPTVPPTTPPPTTTPPVVDERYGAGGVPPVYEAIAPTLDAIREGMPANNTVGAFLARLDRQNPGFAVDNRDALMAYLNDRYTPHNVNQAAQGVHENILGPIAASGGSSIPFPIRAIGQFFGSPLGLQPEWDDDMRGRALMHNLVNQRRRPAAAPAQ